MSEKNEWKLVRVNEAFGDLMYWLERCERKGHLENCSDLVEPWEAFDYEYVAAPGSTSSAPGDAQDERQAVDRLPAYITDDRYHLQYRLGWNNCLADCRAAILADAPAAGDALDAKRYRWLRDHIQEDHSLPGSFWLSDTGGESWDKTIDAAMDYQRQQGDAA